jgi:putative Holliday junction resolvase
VTSGSSDAPGRVLAFDHGHRRIGVAVSDEGRRLATPRTTIEERDPAKALAAAIRLVEEEAPTQLVVGLPLNMDGTEGPAAKAARDFGIALERRAGVPVAMWDERLSSFEADELMAPAGFSRKKRKARRDRIAAQRILTSWLEASPREG